MKIAIVTDSTAYISEELRKKWDIHMLPLLVQMDGDTYREEVDLSAADYYQKKKELENFPTSSQPVIGKTFELFEELAKDHDAIISIHLSSGISGTHNSVSSLMGEWESCPVYPYDSEISCYPQARLVFEAARLAKEGKTPEEIIHALDVLKERTQAYFMVDDLMNLQKGGRLSGGAALVGSVLKIKPILHFQEKKITVFEKIRTQKKAKARIAQLLEEAIERADYPLIATVIHANVEQEARVWMEELKSAYPSVRFEVGYFGPVIGTHLGEGALGLTWTQDKERS